VEAYNGFAKRLNFGGEGVIDTVDPVEQEKHLKYNHLVANAAAIQNVIDLTRAVRDLQADGYFVRREDLAQLSPYQTRRLKRFGDYTLSMRSPEPLDQPGRALPDRRDGTAGSNGVRRLGSNADNSGRQATREEAQELFAAGQSTSRRTVSTELRSA
jgi:hypothetical protein